MKEFTYTNVQFIGHVLSTTPLLKESVEGTSDWGIYLGLQNDNDDINARLKIVSDVLRQAVSTSNISNDSSTLKVFALPEFFWRGIKGAYFYSQKENDEMYKKISDSLINIINDIGKQYDFSNWLFLFGSILTTSDEAACQTSMDDILSKVGDDYLRVYSILKNNAKANSIPAISKLLKIADKKINAENDYDQELSNLLCDILNMSDGLADKNIYNRCFVYYSQNPKAIQKEFKSKEDFILNNPAVSEGTVKHYLQTMVNYPSVSAAGNPVDTLTYSAFNCGGLNIGIEICLDHKRKRLLGYLSEGSIQQQLDIQIVISCGMQLMKDSAATRQGGILFNCDGEYVLEGDAQNGDCCHSQLKTYSYDSSCGPMLSDNIPAAYVTKVNYTAEAEQNMYPHGLGELHIYAPIRVK
ncbi:hypothetical protein LY28_02545 [Ruminiclostridium sufflavum DSM 19573]|uniref:Uncharacterized protein n=1 Tax=Ruminiclostridium sufflavum DSM 19573 TaxID=1121337 RepID=A0A318XIS0_9FIRM|nr:hypothetical protein [Ruminiclostridium sufflavum]PYG86924.1 hypothetical protein LY28_02545 [Ruminiclostridium sufflavum DSM 19573]